MNVHNSPSSDFLLQKAKATKKTTEKKEDDVPPFEQSQITQAKRIMKPFVLRRLKADVLQDLPKKTNYMESCPMSDRQQRLYKELIAAFSSSKDGMVSLIPCIVLVYASTPQIKSISLLSKL